MVRREAAPRTRGSREGGLVNSVKLSITCRQPLEKKYGAKSLALIDAAVARWIAADKARGITTIYVTVDVAMAMKGQGVPAVTGRITPARVKTGLDALVNRPRPEYTVLIGADDVVPQRRGGNPFRDPHTLQLAAHTVRARRFRIGDIFRFVEAEAIDR